MAIAVLNDDDGRARLWRAFGSALGLEVALAALVVAWVATHHAPQPVQVIPLSIEAPAFPQPEKLPDPAPQKSMVSHERQRPKPINHTVPQSQPAVAPVAVPLPGTQAAVPAPTPTATQVPTPVSTPASNPQPAQTPTPAQVADPIPAYNAKLTAAAQAAFEVPGTVTALNFKGRTRVGFRLRDGLPSSISIVQSSGLGAMDRAAIRAVQAAFFPQPPSGLQGKEMAYEIWVTHTPSN